MSNFEDSVPLVTDYTETRLWNYHQFRETVRPLAHMKVLRPLLNYTHHYIVTNIYNTQCGTSVVTVLQYTTSGSILSEGGVGIGKCIRETFEIGENVHNSLLDYENGLFYLDSGKGYPKTEAEVNAAYKRIEERIGESTYHLNWNNCEHLVNYVLTGKNASEQFRQSRRLTDLCNSVLANIKQVGLTTALLVSALGAIAGSLVRRAYVKVILASIISAAADIGIYVPNECPNIMGRNIVEEAQLRMADGHKLPGSSSIPNISLIIKKSQSRLDNTYVCKTAEILAWEALWKMCSASLVTSFGIETIIFLCFIYFNVLPMRRIFLKNKMFCRILFLRIFGGYLSLVVAVALGAVGQCFLSRPVRTFFCISFASGLFFRYAFAILAGCIFDTCSCCFCWTCCPVCIGGWRCPAIGVIIFILIFILCIMATTLWLLLG